MTTPPQFPDLRHAVRDLSEAFQQMQRGMHALGVQAGAALRGETVYRAGLRGPRRPWETRAERARRDRELAYLRRRDRRTNRG